MQSDPKNHAYWDEAAEAALVVLEEKWATMEQIRAALELRRKDRPPIGEIAVKSRKLAVTQVFRILDRQNQTGELFGHIAVDLEFLTPSELNELLCLQATLTPRLSDVLLKHGEITPNQAEALKDLVGGRLRDDLQPDTA